MEREEEREAKKRKRRRMRRRKEGMRKVNHIGKYRKFTTGQKRGRLEVEEEKKRVEMKE